MRASPRLFFACLSFVGFSIAASCSENAPLGSALVNGSGAAGASAGSTGSAGGGGPSTATGGVTGTPATGQAGTPGQGGGAGDSAPGITMCGSPTLAGGMCAPGAFKRVGVCQCQDGAPCVCANGCTDPMTDDDNCGVCGLRCGPTSTCQNGVCGPPPVEFVPAQTGCGSIDLAVSAGTLYWTDQGHAAVRSRSLAGGNITNIAIGEKPSRVAVVGTSVFWLYTNATIRRSVAGATPSTVITAPTSIGGFVVSPDGATVYFSSGTTISRVSAAGGAPIIVAREENGGAPGALVLSGNTLAFPTSINGDVDFATLVDGQIASCGKPGLNGDIINFNCARLARSQGELFVEAILFPTGLVVWADGTNLKSESPSAPGPFDAVAMTNSNAISGIAWAGSNAYFSETTSAVDGTGGVIYRAAIAPNQTALRLARGQNAPRSLATSSTKVYWSTSDCTIESTGL